MKEIRDILAAFAQNRDQPLALATLVRACGSSYRRPGARMLITAAGKTVGTLSGGCLEEEVARRAQDVLATGQPVRLNFDTRLRYGCNGAIEVLVESVHPALLESLAAAQRDRRALTIATIFENEESLGSRVLSSLDNPPPGAFCQTIRPALRLLLIGEGPDSAALRALAAALGWELTEVEEASALPDDFDDRTAAIVKTHNYGRDYAALEKLLPLGLRYVALLGPRLRRDQLLHSLLETGLEMRSQLFSPAGLDLGAESPEEIALAIVAEIQTVFAEASAESLREWKRPIHPARRIACRAGVKIGAVILAAGASSRLGQPKQLLEYHGETLVRRVARAALDAGCRPVALVLGAVREKIAVTVRDLELTILPNDAWERGMGTSIRLGVAALRDCDALFLLASDQPMVSPDLLRELIATQNETQKPMAASAYTGTIGVPALFTRACFAQLLALGDVSGAKALLLARPDEVASVPFAAGAVDIDTPGDYRTLLG